MPTILLLIVSTVGTLLDILLFMMFARAIISWLPNLSQSRLGEFLYTVTEWVILPVRALFDAMNINQPMMIDLPFFVTYIVLVIVSSIL